MSRPACVFFLTARWRSSSFNSLHARGRSSSGNSLHVIRNVKASVCVFSDRTMAQQHRNSLHVSVLRQRVCFFWPHDGAAVALIHCMHEDAAAAVIHCTWSLMSRPACVFFLTARWRSSSFNSLHVRGRSSSGNSLHVIRNVKASVCVFSDRTMAQQHRNSLHVSVLRQRVCFFWPHDGAAVALIHCMHEDAAAAVIHCTWSLMSRPACVFFLTARWRSSSFNSLHARGRSSSGNSLHVIRNVKASVCVFSDRTMAQQ